MCFFRRKKKEVDEEFEKRWEERRRLIEKEMIEKWKYTLLEDESVFQMIMQQIAKGKEEVKVECGTSYGNVINVNFRISLDEFKNLVIKTGD